MMDINILMYLVPSLIMFGCGIYGFITRKNMIAILISLELMLNSVDPNLPGFNRNLFPDQKDRMIIPQLAIAIAGAETTIAQTIRIKLFRIAKKVDINQISKLKF